MKFVDTFDDRKPRKKRSRKRITQESEEEDE